MSNLNYQAVNQIRQVLQQMEQSEARNAQLLQQLQQAEQHATQQVRQLQQLVSQIDNTISIGQTSLGQSAPQVGYGFGTTNFGNFGNVGNTGNYGNYGEGSNYNQGQTNFSFSGSQF